LLGDDYYVLRASAENTDLLGARLVSIDQHPIARSRETSRSLLGGVIGLRDKLIASFFESPEQMAALHVTARPDRATYTFVSQNGRTVTRVLAGEAPGPNRYAIGATRVYFPQPTASEGSWRPALSPASAPWSLSDPDAVFRWRAIPEL